MKSPGLGRIMTMRGMSGLMERMTLRRPREGVNPPAARHEQTSSLSAPPSMADFADRTESTQTSKRGLILTVNRSTDQREERVLRWKDFPRRLSKKWGLL